jgi:hypothetical protein
VVGDVGGRADKKKIKKNSKNQVKKSKKKKN